MANAELLTALVCIIVILTAVVLFLLIRLICRRMELKSLCMQLDELARGSHMELFVSHKDRACLLLCQRLNKITALQRKREIQYEKAQKRLKQNISALAHDIRTPLTSAAGYLVMGAECPDKETRERYLSISGKRLNELKDMLEELFLYTKLSSDEFELSIRPVQVLPLLSECLVSMYQQFEERGVSPCVEFENEGFLIQADEEALSRIFRNLIQNALQHGAGEITILQHDSQLIFENPLARDSQIDITQIFDRFYKADTARRSGSSGMGLAIVKELVEKMGGQISADINQGFLRIRIAWNPSL